MPGAMRKMGVYLGLVEDDDLDVDTVDDERGRRSERYDRYESDRRDADRYDDVPATSRSRARDWSDSTEHLSGHAGARTGGGLATAGLPAAGVAPAAGGLTGRSATAQLATRSAFADAALPEPVPAAPAAPAASTYQITTLHPRTYNEARQIGEHYRVGTPVIMNLSEMDDADAKRLVDFAAGLTFGLRGRLERVTAKVFLLSPQNVTVTAEDKARIVEGGFFNQS